MSYKLGQQNQVIHVKDGATLPCRFENGAVVSLDEHSPIVKEFEAWVAAGNVPAPFPLPTPEQTAKAQLAAIDAATAPRFVREGLLGFGDLLAYIRAVPPGLDAAGVAAYMQACPTPGTGMAKLQAVENQAIALREQLAPK